MGYLGSKSASGAYQAIIALMPPHDTYVELFAGSGAVLIRKPQAASSFAVDLDARPLAAIRASLPEVKCCRVDAIAFIDAFDYSAGGRVLIYADPPYLHSVRSSRARYAYEMSDAQHIELLERLKRVPAAVILSGYWSLLYERHLAGWHRREFQSMTRGGPRTEQLWYNFEPRAVQWCTFAGRGFTDRQRIKRKAARWAQNFRRMPPAERTAVLAAILQADPA